MAPPHLTGDQYGDPQGGTYRDGGSGAHSGAPYRPEVPGAAPYGDGIPAYGEQPQHRGGFAAGGGAPGGYEQGRQHDPYLPPPVPGYGDAPAGYGRPAAAHPGGESGYDAPGVQHPGDEDGGYDDEPDEPLVRPYAMTGGRTRPRYQLAIEALVSTTGQAAQNGLLPEHQRIVELCAQVKSVAEISALLNIPLGVARILVADLAEAGLVAIHQPGSTEAGQPDVTLLERVLSGLRKL